MEKSETAGDSGANLRADPIRLAHADLKPFVNGESAYQRRCPVCEAGVLLVRRDDKTLELVNVDRCINCGQTVVYTDASIGGAPLTDVTKQKRL